MRSSHDIKTERKLLTLSGSRNALIISCCSAMLFAVVGLAELKHGIKIHTVFFCFAALSQLFSVPEKWKNYCLVKRGDIVYLPPPQAHPHLPKPVSIVIASVLTAVVGVSSILAVVVISASIKTPAACLIIGAVLLSLWLFTGYCWHRTFTENPQAKPKVLQEQTEGVWPPAPLIADGTRNED